MLRIALTLTLLILTLSSPAHADITGKARVVDGDTIHIGKTKIRLHGIDAPEMKQTCRTSKGKEQQCGQLAKQALERLVKGQDCPSSKHLGQLSLFRNRGSGPSWFDVKPLVADGSSGVSGWSVS